MPVGKSVSFRIIKESFIDQVSDLSGSSLTDKSICGRFSSAI
jgi:hypothetical protein